MKRSTLLIIALICSVFFVFSCSKELSLEGSLSTNSAEGSLWDSSENCLPNTVNGTFYTGIQPGSDTAFVEIQVDVVSPGTYKIITDLQNGFQFADSGYFATAGINTVLLKPLGIPVAVQTTLFTFSFDSSTCFVAVTVQDSTGTGLGGGVDTTGGSGSDTTNQSQDAWKFSVGSNYYHGDVDFATITDTLGFKFLTILGSDPSTNDTIFSVGVFFTGVVGPGSYKTDFSSQLSLATIDTLSNYVVLYQANPGTASSGTSTITITAYNASTGIMSGTFSGTALDKDGNLVTISNGSFKVKVT